MQRLTEQLRANGCEVLQEVPAGAGKTIDLVARRNGKRIALEIETGKSDAAANVYKCLNAGMDRTVVVATSRSTKARIEPTLPDDPRVVCVAPDEAPSGGWFASEQPGPVRQKGAPRESRDNLERRRPDRQPPSTRG